MPATLSLLSDCETRPFRLCRLIPVNITTFPHRAYKQTPLYGKRGFDFGFAVTHIRRYWHQEERPTAEMSHHIRGHAPQRSNDAINVLEGIFSYCQHIHTYIHKFYFRQRGP